MEKGSAILDISSNSAYALPNFIIPRRSYPLAETDEDLFVQKVVKRSQLARTPYEKSGFAYAISKNFVVWYARKSAFGLGPRGIRVSTLSPGLVSTGMGEREAEAGHQMIERAAEHPWARLQSSASLSQAAQTSATATLPASMCLWMEEARQGRGTEGLTGRYPDRYPPIRTRGAGRHVPSGSIPVAFQAGGHLGCRSISCPGDAQAQPPEAAPIPRSRHPSSRLSSHASRRAASRQRWQGLQGQTFRRSRT